MEGRRASAPGAPASQLEAFLLSRGGLPSGLAQELRLLGNPGTTLPVPVPSGMTAQQLKIGGAPAGLFTQPAHAAPGGGWGSPGGAAPRGGGPPGSARAPGVAPPDRSGP